MNGNNQLQKKNNDAKINQSILNFFCILFYLIEYLFPKKTTKIVNNVIIHKFVAVICVEHVSIAVM